MGPAAVRAGSRLLGYQPFPNPEGRFLDATAPGSACAT